MVNYKIRIFCTSKEDLTFEHPKNERPISNIRPCKNTDIKIHPELKPKNIDYVDAITILYRTISQKIPTKLKIRYYFELSTHASLEYECNRKITELEFQEFIDKMRSCGYYSENNNEIQFINVENGKIIYNYDFNLNNPKDFVQRKRNKENKSTYSRQQLSM
jgi:hypothetical protein